MAKVRNLCFTLNNYTQDEYDALFALDTKYIVIGKEVGENLTPHLQGYLEFKNPRSFKALKKFNPRIHWESRRGTSVQASDYCKKDKDFVEKGKLSRQGNRTDIQNVTNSILKGKTVTETALEFPETYLKYHKGMDKLRNIVLKTVSKEFRQVKVIVLYGKTGSGKTRRAIESAGNDYYKLDQANNVWFDGYDGEKTLIIDDFYGWIRFGHLLNILDGHPLRLEVKGGFTYALWTTVYITSNVPHHEWYKLLTQTQRDALERRITEVEFMQ